MAARSAASSRRRGEPSRPHRTGTAALLETGDEAITPHSIRRGSPRLTPYGCRHHGPARPDHHDPAGLAAAHPYETGPPPPVRALSPPSGSDVGGALGTP